MPSIELVLLGLLAVVAAALVLRLLVRLVGCNCGECGRRMTGFEALSLQDRQAITRHYLQRESRRVDTAAVFICRACCLVYDDFSGEQRSLEGDERSICKVCGEPHVRYLGHLWLNGQVRRLVQANEGLVDRIECLRCERRPRHCAFCDTDPKVTGCANCGALFAWETETDSGLRFQVVLGDRPVLKEARDRTGGLV